MNRIRFSAFCAAIFLAIAGFYFLRGLSKYTLGIDPGANRIPPQAQAGDVSINDVITAHYGELEKLWEERVSKMQYTPIELFSNHIDEARRFISFELLGEELPTIEEMSELEEASLMAISILAHLCDPLYKDWEVASPILNDATIANPKNLFNHVRTRRANGYEMEWVGITDDGIKVKIFNEPSMLAHAMPGDLSTPMGLLSAEDVSFTWAAVIEINALAVNASHIQHFLILYQDTDGVAKILPFFRARNLTQDAPFVVKPEVVKRMNEEVVY